jgi:hypothetical protein
MDWNIWHIPKFLWPVYKTLTQFFNRKYKSLLKLGVQFY